MTPDAIDRLCERIAKLHATASLDEHEAAMNDVRAALEGERERAEKLRKALISHDGHGGEKWCHVCGKFWPDDEPEIHEPGCLSAPDPEPRDPAALEER